MLKQIRFYSSITAVYLLTIGTIGATLLSSHLFGSHSDSAQMLSSQTSPVPSPAKEIIAGKPIRIIIADREIDLPVEDGGYDAKSKSWILSETNADYAVTSARANNHSGTTFIYGHGTDQVFGKIGSNPPPVGTIAQIHTDTGHIFTYKLQAVLNLKPSDTSILSGMAGGAPGLIVQTCTGALSEWRTMFKFTYESVS